MMGKNKRIGELLVLLSEIFNQELSPTLSKLYVQILSGYPIEKVESAVMNIIKHRIYPTMPKPAELLQYLDPPESLDLNAIEALRELSDKIIIRGSYYSVKFNDPTIHFVVQSYGGWIALNEMLREMNNRDYTFWEKEFQERYRLYYQKQDKGRPPRMVGIHERENTFKGYLTADSAVPNYIEDVEEYKNELEHKNDEVSILLENTLEDKNI